MCDRLADNHNNHNSKSNNNNLVTKQVCTVLTRT